MQGVELQGEDGTTIVVQLLADDAGTWMPWLQTRPHVLLTPGTRVRHPRLTPVVWPPEAVAAQGKGASGPPESPTRARV